MNARNLITLTLMIFLAGCGVNVAERNNDGNLRLLQGSYAEALQAYETALIAEPDNATLYFNIANAYLQSGDFEAAEAAFDQTIRRGEPDIQAAAYYNLANYYFTEARYEDAVLLYQDALRITPDWSDARFNLELALSMIEQPTPTPIEMQTQLDEDQVNPDAIPTPNPGGQELPTPTPPPPEQLLGPTPDGGGETGVQVEDDRITPIPEPMGELSIEQAQRILDAIEIDQAGIGGLPEPDAIVPTPLSARDW